MQIFEYGNKRIEIENHLVTRIRTVATGKGKNHGKLVDVAKRHVRNTNSVMDFSRRNQANHFILPCPEWRPQYVSIKNKLTRQIGVIVWRGDTRSPEEIFSTGFEPRIRGLLTPVWRCQESDVYPITSVCLSLAFESAVLFPLINQGEVERIGHDATWLYAIVLEQNQKYLNTQWIQREVADRRIPSGGGAIQVADANSKAAEVCTQIVAGGSVISAVRVVRKWTNTDWTRLGHYKVDHASFKLNSRATNFAAKTQARITIRGMSFKATKMVRYAGEGLNLFENNW